MVDSMKQSFLLQPEVLTPNRNGFMAKKRKWHLKAGSTVYARAALVWTEEKRSLRNEKLKQTELHRLKNRGKKG